MRIRVTSQDIRRAGVAYTILGRDSSASCPIARALKRQSGYRQVNVFQSKCVLTQSPEDNLRTFHLPREARHFIADFDSKLPVKPFSFELPIKKAGSRAK